MTNPSFEESHRDEPDRCELISGQSLHCRPPSRAFLGWPVDTKIHSLVKFLPGSQLTDLHLQTMATGRASPPEPGFAIVGNPLLGLAYATGPRSLEHDEGFVDASCNDCPNYILLLLYPLV